MKTLEYVMKARQVFTRRRSHNSRLVLELMVIGQVRVERIVRHLHGHSPIRFETHRRSVLALVRNMRIRMNAVDPSMDWFLVQNDLVILCRKKRET